MMNIDNETKSKIIRLIHALAPEATIYLFGSRALGTHHSRSDIDIALDASTKIDRLTVGEISDILNASNIPYHFDVVDLHNISEDMKEDILTKGIIWMIGNDLIKK